MDESYKEVACGAMLHDIGKPVQRARWSEGSHEEIGADFVSGILLGEEWQEVIRCIRYHHVNTLKNARIPENSLAYLVYEADNIAAGADRRKKEETWGKRPFRPDLPLHSVFNVFQMEKSSGGKAFPLRTLEESGEIIFPEPEERIQVSVQKYDWLLQNLTKGFQEMRLSRDTLESLLKLMEAALAYVPSSTSTGEVPDISLYNHLKITAMVAGCYYYYLAAQGIRTYRLPCYEQPEKLRREKTMLLVSGDMSGIQNFIYTIASKRALKSLRGRSFYLEIFMEHVIDEILENCGLCRANLLYSGGGRFYLVLPNTGKTKEVLRRAKEKINWWLLRQYGTELYLEISTTEASAYELTNGMDREEKEENMLGNLFREVSRANSLGKLRRYSLEQLAELTDPDSSLNRLRERGRECSVCRTSRHQLREEEDGWICPNCLALFRAGDKLARMDDHTRDRPVVVMRQDDLGGELLSFPLLEQGEVYLAFAGMKEGEKLLQQGQARRIYSLNSFLTGANYMTNLWAGTYSAPGEGEGLVDFATLAERSTGIKRIGVLRADVDNLGQAFDRGFILPPGMPERHRYLSLSRSAALSYHLSMFFKFEINKLCRGKTGSLTPFRLPGKKGEAAREKDVVIVYAGGDDVFIVGAWDQVLELAVDLHRAWQKFTDGKMTLSAGVGIFGPSFPVSQMAALTGNLEQAAKSGSKNQIALFGSEIGEEEEGQPQPVFRHVYSWDDFTEKVCGEKLAGMIKWFSFDEKKREAGKLACGMSRLYKLLRLYRGIDAGWEKGERINLARLAYDLGRMEPAGKEREALGGVYREMKHNLYQWALTEKDRKELVTALNILVYLNRKEEGEHE